MSTKQLLATAVLFAVSITSTSAAYDEIECSTDAVFSANACDQCFEWWQKAVGDNVWLIDDEWKNVSNTAKIMYKENQTMPRMLSLGGSNWSQVPDSDNFWEYTPELEALYSEDDQGYVLEAGANVKFIQSALDSAYLLESSESAQWENIGLLVFPLLSHTMMEDGDISTDDSVHNECVLFKAGASEQEQPTTPSTPEPEPKEMAQVETGAEAYLILLFALILGFVYIKTRRQTS